MKLALVGLGYWGPNLLRNFNSHRVVAAAFELNIDLLRKYATDPAYSGVFFDTDWEKCLGRVDIDTVVIATPPNTHFGLAMKALDADKHVFIEKPMTTNVEDAEEILKLAKERDRIVMVGHTFLYTPEVRRIKELIDSDELGDILYIHASRLNLGKFQKENVVSDLSPHDISIFNYLFDGCPVNASGRGQKCLGETLEDLTFATLEYPDNILANIGLYLCTKLNMKDMTVREILNLMVILFIMRLEVMNLNLGQE